MKYRVYGTVTGSKYLGEIEANSKEEAEKKAWEGEECYVSLCYECASECNDPEITEIVVEEIEDETMANKSR